MLSSKRIFATLALGLATALIAAGLLLPRMIAPTQPVPLDLSHTTITLHDPAATIGPNFRQGEGLADAAPAPVTAPVVRQFNLTLSEPATADTASARLGITTSRQDIDDDLRSLLDAQVWTFKVDRRTGEILGEAKVADTPATPATTVASDAQWAKFPIDTTRDTYDYFDVTLREGIPAHFKEAITRTDATGHEAELYIFRQDIEPTNVAERYTSPRTSIPDPTRPEDPNATADLYHSGWREITVEPRTGLIVRVDESIRDYYATADGRDVQDLLNLHAVTTQAAEQRMLEQALDASPQRHTHTVSMVLLGLGAIVLAMSLMVIIRSARRRADR